MTLSNSGADSAHLMAATSSPYDVLAEELGAVAARIERESTLRLAAALADLERRDAERELRLERLERSIRDRLAEVRDGEPGLPGADGAPGATGAPGERGADGAPGAKGDPGADGAAGAKGDKGDKGDVGPMGPAGESITGPAGADGAPGAKGDTGDRGAPGDIGPQGPPGPAGPAGESVAGPPGPMGPAGAKGDTGAPGEPGIGTKGDPGTPGAKGDAGDPGAPGAPGAPGERGAEGPPGKLPVAKAWQADVVHYQGDVVVHESGTYQARCDTARGLDSADWVCLARAGAPGVPGRSLNICKTYDPAKTYAHLDVVTLNASWFVAMKDNPGPCPGPGWQIGPSGKTGHRGERGEKGEPGDSVISWRVDREHYLAVPVMASGADGPVLDLRILFEQFEAETSSHG
jgi:integrin beta 3